MGAQLSTSVWIALAVALAAPLAGCGPGGSGGEGDPLAVPAADPYGTGQRLSELANRVIIDESSGMPRAHVLGPATWLDAADDMSASCNIPSNEKVRLTGLTLTSIDDYDETGTGATGNLYVQDTLNDLPTYSGITVFSPGFSPPDLRLAPGDVVDIFGFAQEFIGPGLGSQFGFCRTLPEISGSMEFRFEGSGILPRVVPASDFADYDKARQWLGMLVTIENVEMLEDPFESSSGRYSVRIDTGDATLMSNDIPSISNELYDMKTLGPALQQGQVAASVTGIVTYFYAFHIAPRSAADIVL
jgi:hypothetical protein